MKGIDKMGIESSLENKKGFTIIEVVLVLAIAGLIFLMVFIAYPPLARNQRDTQRRDDYAALATAVTNYMTNNNGRLPTSCGKSDSTAKFKTTQINKDGNDPGGRQYELSCSTQFEIPTGVGTYSNDSSTGPKVYVVPNATCDGDQPAKGGGARSFAIYGELENGTYCNAST